MPHMTIATLAAAIGLIVAATAARADPPLDEARYDTPVQLAQATPAAHPGPLRYGYNAQVAQLQQVSGDSSAAPPSWARPFFVGKRCGIAKTGAVGATTAAGAGLAGWEVAGTLATAGAATGAGIMLTALGEAISGGCGPLSLAGDAAAAANGVCKHPRTGIVTIGTFGSGHDCYGRSS